MNLTSTQKAIIRILLVERSSSRGQLASKLSLTNAALTLALKPLLNENIILESRNDEGELRPGRKELLIKLNGEYCSFLSIDIRKHNAYYVITDFNGDILSSSNSAVEALDEFVSKAKPNIISVGACVRGDSSLEVFKALNPSIYACLEKLGIPYFVFNNVSCLADIHYLFHNEDKNFLLIKYGPGLGSSIYVSGRPLGCASELGHTFYENKTVEETISFSSLLGKEIEEKEGTELLLSEEGKLDKVIGVLAFAIYNADCLLSLQKIILSGELLTSIAAIKKLENRLTALDSKFDTSKLCSYPSYKELNVKKGALGAFIKTFGKD